MIQEKINLLKKECEIENLPFKDIDLIITDFYKLLFEVITEKEHEKKVPLCGLIITEKLETRIKYSKISYYLENTSDGEKSFQLLEKGSKPKTVIFENKVSQKELLSLVSEKDEKTIVIIRSELDIRIYYKGTISILEGRLWKKTKNISEILSQIKNIDQSINTQEFRELLFFAFYELSLNKIGTTIVFFHKSRIYNKWFDPRKSKNINFNKDSEKEILKNYLRFNDGAIILSKNLKVSYTNIFLQHKPNTEKKVDQYSGTRHTSAACYSYEHENLYVITVSDDGPVSIFHKGQKIEKLNFMSSKEKIENNRTYADALSEMATERGDIAENWEETVTCPDCKSQYLLSITKITGWNDREEFDCPQCHKTIITRSCFELRGVRI